jgi:Mg-chelatase subunit ChlD
MEALMTQNVSICIVLDRSGSMETCRLDALGAVNSYLRQVRDDADLTARVSVVLFDTQGIDRIRDHVPIASCPDVTAEEYQPRGGTPLLDAVGHAAGLLESRSERDIRSILVIMTDGHENSSREHTKETIAALLRRKQQENNWLVVYLGADHDAWDQARHLGLMAANTASFNKMALAAAGSALYKRSARYSKSGDVKADQELGFSVDERSELKGE